MGDASLNTVVLPDGLQTIQSKAFAGSGVTNVNLQGTLTFIAEDAFDDTNIASFRASEGTYAYTWAMEHDYLDWKWEDQPDGTVVITAYNRDETDIAIPAQLNGKRVSAIGNAALARSELVSVTVPGAIDRIGEAAFAGSGYLKSVTVAQGVKKIGAEAFADCPILFDVTLPQSGVTLGSRLFRYCSLLGTVTLPGATGEIVVPDGVTAIGDYAFSELKNITRVVIPFSVLEMGINTFQYCSALTAVEINGPITLLPQDAFLGCTALASVSLPDTITSIGSFAFNNSGIITLTLSAQLKAVRSEAFLWCESLESLVFPEDMLELEVSAIEECPNLTSVTFPASVKVIGQGNFKNCPNVVIHAPEGSYAYAWALTNHIPVEAL